MLRCSVMRSMGARSLLGVVLVLGALLVALGAWAEVPTSRGELHDKLTRLEEHATEGTPLADMLSHARLALGRSETRRASGDEEGAGRAEQIAEAALLLAERRLALAEEEGRLAAAEARRDEALSRARAARAALESALAQRARTLGPSREATPAGGPDGEGTGVQADE